MALALTAGAAGCFGSDDTGNPESVLTPDQVSEPLHGAPPQLREIRAQANQLLDGGTDAINARLDELHGTPVVINNWGSWCAPCRAEFPIFQAVANRLGAEVAFLGVDSDDPEDAARTFLGELPLPYPSYVDPDNDIRSEVFDSPVGQPNTAFFDSGGERVYVHQGPYASEGELTAEINRYAR
jgi:cytochrome c biogenesis protein CcmG, thiol:disulfide interchange protein DsbE